MIQCDKILRLTHWGHVTHTCVGKLTIICSDNGLSPDRRQAIIWTNAGLLLIGPLGTNFSEILIEIIIFSFKKMRLKWAMLARPQCVSAPVTKRERWLSANYTHTSQSRTRYVVSFVPYNKLTTIYQRSGWKDGWFSGHYSSCWPPLGFMALLCHTVATQFMRPTRGPPGTERTQVGPVLAPWTLLSG